MDRRDTRARTCRLRWTACLISWSRSCPGRRSAASIQHCTPSPASRSDSRWSIAGLRDLITIQLARMTQHPAWTTLLATTHPPNTINFKINDLKFNAG
jgi:hypothetical protein